MSPYERFLPGNIRLDASTVCQLKCPSCSTAKGIVHKNIGTGFLSLDNFKNIIEANPWLSKIELSNYGEIFLNPELGQMIKFAYENNVELTAQNGVNLNTVDESVLEDLVKYKFRFINCSIDGSSQDTYKIYRVNGNFDAVIDNIRKINYFKKKYKSKFPDLRWQFVAMGHNQHEIEMARDMATKLDMDFFVKLSWDPDFSPVTDHELVSIATGTNVSSRKEYEEKNSSAYMSNVCNQLWKTPQINQDGKVLGCCINLWGDFGENSFEVGLERALNGKILHDAKLMLEGRSEPIEGVPCTECYIYKSRQKHDDWVDSSEFKKFNTIHRKNYFSDRKRVAVVNRLNRPLISVVVPIYKYSQKIYQVLKAHCKLNKPMQAYRKFRSAIK